ncbi:MAG TPA: kynureninase [Steroidobacteraceae bacterium]|nr:kynureninase [Steroidobacteraceae bacterium]
MSHEPTLEYACALDEQDPLRSFRGQFALPADASGHPLLYLCGHSLGLMPLEARRVVEEELDRWARLGVLGHEAESRPWIPYHRNVTAGLAYLGGARPDEVIAMNSLTVNLHLMLASFYRPLGRRVKILIEAGAFPSDRHAVASQLGWHGHDPDRTLIELAPARGEDTVSHEAIEACLDEHGADIALVLWPGVQYRTGQAFDVERVVQAAHRAGCIAGIDLAHAIGNVPLELHAWGVDFAVWCNYKYLNAGPGAIGGCFVHERHLQSLPTTRLQGWWGHEASTRFRMEPQFEPEPGAAAWQISNPPILSTAPLLPSLDLFRQAGIERLRGKSRSLTGLLEFLLAPLGPDVALITPCEPAARGCQLSLRIAGRDRRGRRILDRLAQLGAVCDWREPDTIRVAPVPLYNTHADVFRFSELLAQALREPA